MKKYLLAGLLFSMACANVSAAAEGDDNPDDQEGDPRIERVLSDLLSLTSIGTLERLAEAFRKSDDQPKPATILLIPRPARVFAHGFGPVTVVTNKFNRTIGRGDRGIKLGNVIADEGVGPGGQEPQGDGKLFIRVENLADPFYSVNRETIDE